MNENRIRSIFPSDDIRFPESYRSLVVPAVSERPEGSDGMIIYNRQNKALEAFYDGDWVQLALKTEIALEAKEIDPNELLEPGINVRLESKAGKTVIHVPEVGDFTVGENIGIGTGTLYRGKDTSRLLFRRLVSDSEGLQIVTDADTVRFSMKENGDISIGRTLGTGIPVYAGKNEHELLFRSLKGSETILLEPSSSGEVKFNLSPFLDLQKGQLLLPRTETSHAGTPGEIRYNDGMDRYEVGSKDGWRILSTDQGTFLPLSGGKIGHLEFELGAKFGESELIVDGGVIKAGSKGMTINLENGGRIITGFQGTIDGFRIPMIGAQFTELNDLNSGWVIKKDGHFFTVSVSGTENQIDFDQTRISIAANPTIPGFGSIVLPSGPSKTRDMRTGGIRYNSETDRFEGLLLNGWEDFATTNTGKFSELRVNGEMHLIGRINGREIQNDFDLIDQIDAIRGIPYRGPNGWIATRIMADANKPGVHISDSGSEIKIGLETEFINVITKQIVDGLDHTVIRADTHLMGRTIDGRNLSKDGMVIDDLSGLTPGIVVADGTGQFWSRSIMASAHPNAAGLSVDRPSGDGDIRLGLRLSELPEVEEITADDWIIVSTATGNAKISLANLKKILGS